MQETIYNEGFYDLVLRYNYPAAKAVVPIVCNFFTPKKVIDFGCGVGCWLKAFDEYCELEKMMGLEGDWLSKEKLMIPEKNIRYVDFMMGQELSFEDKYDLAICLEVAEHIDEENGEHLLNNMTRASDIILFSAAIPQQGGDGHINERWQSYWVKKFQQREYVCLDILRPIMWNNQEVLAHYRQNMFLYVNEKMIEKMPELQPYLNNKPLIDVVHPEIYSQQRVARKIIEKNKADKVLAKKYFDMFSLITKWMDKEFNGRHLKDWFHKKNIAVIAIYGMGDIGKLIYRILKDTDIKIPYAMDRLEGIVCGDLEIYQLTWSIEPFDLPYVEAVVVTPIMDYEEISNELNLRMDAKILCFKEIVEEL